MATASAKQPTFDFMSRKPLWFAISFLLILPGLIGLFLCFSQTGLPLRMGIDFTGGSMLQASFTKPVTAAQVQGAVAKAGIADAQVQIADGKTAIIRMRSLKEAERLKVGQALKADPALGAYTGERYENVGPTIGKELLASSGWALVFTLVGIVAYISYRYQFDFAMCAILSLVHVVVFLVGTFALLGALFHVEVDSLFVTAVLTVLGFCVHDTIIIFDRIRENMFNAGKRDTFDDVANRSIAQTLRRSVYTALTVCLTLVAMLLFGGETIRFFVLAMLLGIVVGTYGSIFNASQLLAMVRMWGVKKSAA